MTIPSGSYGSGQAVHPTEMRLYKYVFAKWREACDRFGYEEYAGFPAVDYAEPSPSRLYTISQTHPHASGGDFFLLNTSLSGMGGLVADQEIIELADAIMRSFGAKRSMYTIKVNSRKLAALVGNAFGTSPSARLDQQPSLTTLAALITALHEDGITNVEFDPTLTGGSDRYTDVVFKIVGNGAKTASAMLSGGRYDYIPGDDSAEAVPVAGFSVSGTALAAFLEKRDLLPRFRTEMHAYVVLFGDVHEKARKVIQELRSHGVNLVVDLSGQSADVQTKTAKNKGVSHAVLIGEQELADELFELKNLATGQSQRHSLPRIVSILKDRRGSN